MVQIIQNNCRNNNNKNFKRVLYIVKTFWEYRDDAQPQISPGKETKQ